MHFFFVTSLLFACGLDASDNEFTCKLDDACGEYRAPDADRANELKSQCLTNAENGLTCGDEGYSYVCYFVSDKDGTETCTWTNDPGSNEICEREKGSTTCLL